MVTAQDLLRTDYASVDVKDTISKLLGKLARTRQHSAVVFDGKKYKGIVSRRFLLTSRINPKQMKVGNIIKHRSKSKISFYVPKLEPQTSLWRICKAFVASDTHMLPVMRGEKLLGVVNAHDVVKEIAPVYRGIACDELATPQPVVVREYDEIGKAIQLFNRRGIDHLPIVDKSDRLMGMITLSDLLQNPQFWGPTKRMHIPASNPRRGGRSGSGTGEKTQMIGLPVRNCMSRKGMCCTQPSTPIPEAIAKMDKNTVCNIILVRYDKPVGILTMSDIMRDYAK